MYIAQGEAVGVIDFSAFDDRNGYNGKVYSIPFWARLHREHLDRNMSLFTRTMQMTGGDIFCADHSFKINRLVRVKGQKMYEATYTLMNGDNEIVGCWFTKSANLEDVRDVLEQVASRMKQHGDPGPLIWYSDNCCHEENFLKQVIHPGLPQNTNQL